MKIKFGELEQGAIFMFASAGAATTYMVESVTKISDYTTQIKAIGRLSNRRQTFKKTNSVRVIVFNH